MSRVTVFLTVSAIMLSIIAVHPQQLLPDPKAMLSDLIAEVIQLNLKAGITNSFDAKLSAATAALDDSKDQNDQAAINAMYAFMNAVNAQRNTRLTDTQADALVAAAQAIIQAASTSAITFSDDFNDGNADGWWLGPSLHTPWVNGNWRVENGTLVQDAPGDAFVALVQNIDVSTQSLSTDVFPFQVAGYAGLTFWHQDPQNWISIVLYPGPGVCINEMINGVSSAASWCIPHQLTQATIHNLMVDVDAVTGQITVYADGVFVTVFQASTANRHGQSGLIDGNSGAYFENFQLRAPGDL